MGVKKYFTKEYLNLSNTREMYRIDVADICYIQAQGNYSIIYLNNGEYIQVLIKLGIFKDTILKSLKCFEEDFYTIGRSFIVNKKNLTYINLSESKLEFSGKRTEDYLRGYKDGYSAGHRDGLINVSTFMPSDPMVLKKGQNVQLPKEDLKELMDSFKRNINEITKE